MTQCKHCGSHAINPALHGRDGSDLDLCDVCYWRKRADAERQRCLSIIRAYQVPVGNSAAGELAAEWTMAALREVCEEIEAGAPLAQPEPPQDVARCAPLSAGCRQRRIAEGKPYSRSHCAACGPLAPAWRDCDAALAASKGAKQ